MAWTFFDLSSKGDISRIVDAIEAMEVIEFMQGLPLSSLASFLVDPLRQVRLPTCGRKPSRTSSSWPNEG